MDAHVEGGLKGGLEYFVRSFLGGVVLGLARIFILEQFVSQRIGMMVELPLMLFWAWVSCQQAAASQGVPASVKARVIMGAAAFGCLKIAEQALANKSILQGNNLVQRAASLEAWQGGSGFAGSILFALFPFIQASM